MSSCRPGRQAPVQLYELIKFQIRSAASCAIRLGILQKTVQLLTRKMTVAKMTKRNVRVLNQCHKLRQVTQVLQAKVKVNRTMLSAISVDNEVTFPPSAHHQLCFVSWNSSHQFINLAQRQPLCVGVDK